ncbi:hypothetical protein CAPTEDRAFT_40325, partial [Capitella teleta]
KSPGPDCLHPKVLHGVKRIMQSGSMPADWKEATIVPIYKKNGSKQDPCNYRPVSLTPVLSKVFERMLRDRALGQQR